MNSIQKIRGIMLSILSNIVACSISIVSIFPIVWMIYSSMKNNDEFMLDTLSLPQEITLSNYPRAMEVGNLLAAAGNSAVYVIVNIGIICLLSTISGYFFARYEFKFKKIMYFTYLLGMLIPLYGLLIPVFVQYKLLDMLNQRLPVMIIYFGMLTPLTIILIESFIKGISVDIEEAAIMDGCNLFQCIFKIIFPLCKPILGVVCIFTALQTWNEFAFASVLVPHSDMRTISVAIRSFSTGQEVEYTYLIAALVCASIPIITVYLLFSKQVINSMVAGAVKG